MLSILLVQFNQQMLAQSITLPITFASKLVDIDSTGGTGGAFVSAIGGGLVAVRAVGQHQPGRPQALRRGRGPLRRGQGAALPADGAPRP